MRNDTSKQVLTANILPNKLDIFKYEMYHCFFGFAGFLRLLVSTSCLTVALIAYKSVPLPLILVLIAMGMLNPIVTPIWLYYKASCLERLQQPAKYQIGSKEFTVQQGEKRATVPWDSLLLTVWERSNLILYVKPATALILPHRQLRAIESELKTLIRALPDQDRVRIRRFYGK